MNGRRAVGIELKPSYFRQAVKNLESCETGGCEIVDETPELFTESA